MRSRSRTDQRCTKGNGLLLLLLSLSGWCSPSATLSPLALVGAALLAGGFLIWALAAASNFAPDGQLPFPFPFPFPTWLYTALVAIGTPIVAATRFRLHGAPFGAALLVGLGAPLGMVLLATPEWVSALSGMDIDWPVSPVPGQLALAIHAVGWSWAGLAVKRRFAHERARAES